MKRMGGLLGILLVALLAFSTDVPPARWAFASSGVIVVNPGCAASPTPAPATGQQVTYVDANGNACTSGSGGGGGSVTQGTAPWLVAPLPTGTSSNAIAPVLSLSAEGTHVLKGAPGNLYDVYVTTGATAGYLMVFNATSAPIDGGVRPAECVPVAANATASVYVSGAPPEFYDTGITAVFSTTGCFIKTVSATAYFHGRVQ